MKWHTAPLLLCLLLAVMQAATAALIRHSLYQFPGSPAQAAATCTKLLNVRKNLMRTKCGAGCKAAITYRWPGPSVGYDIKKDFNCMIVGTYPTSTVFSKYQAAEKSHVPYTSVKKLAKLNANYMGAT